MLKIKQFHQSKFFIISINHECNGINPNLIIIEKFIIIKLINNKLFILKLYKFIINLINKIEEEKA